MKHQLKEKTISIREVHRNLSEIVESINQGNSFLVTKNGKPAFKMEPVNAEKPRPIRVDFKDLQFDGGSPDDSQRIDEIVYEL